MNVIETDRLILRRFTVDDAPFILALLNDPDWIKYIGDRGVRTIDDARANILNVHIAAYQRQGFGFYLTARKADGQSIGLCGLIKREGLEDVDIGFAFLPDFRAAGYATEAALAVMAYARNNLKLTRIVGITSQDNVSSIKLLKKIGLKYERMVTLPKIAGEVMLFAGETKNA